MLARVEGFEPPTPGLEGLCSIQLSYTRQDDDARAKTAAPTDCSCIRQGLPRKRARKNNRAF